MDVVDFRYLSIAVETGNLSRAAESLGRRRSARAARRVGGFMAWPCRSSPSVKEMPSWPKAYNGLLPDPVMSATSLAVFVLMRQRRLNRKSLILRHPREVPTLR